MQGNWRSVTAAEQSTQDADAALPFGHFAPNAAQRALIALDAKSQMTSISAGTQPHLIIVTMSSSTQPHMKMTVEAIQ